MNPYAILGAVVIGIALAAGGWHLGARNERVTWQQKEIATQAAHIKAMDDAVIKANKEREINEENARKASAKHAQDIKDLKKKYATDIADIKSRGGLRIPVASCDKHTGSPEGTSPGRPNEGSTGTIALPEQTQEDLFDIVKEADELAAQLRALQGWAKDNGHYGPAPK